MDAPGNISWAITATALVLLMTPGVAFFYGGLVKAKSVVSMMMMSFGSIGLVAVLWILFGFSMSAVDSPTAFAGNPFADFGLSNLASGEGSNVALLGVAYGATFAIITVALISGAIADRAKFGSWLIFAGVFATVGYFPVAAWVWGGGWIMNLGTTLFGEDSGIGVIDYAGGTAVHINAGAAALALALVLGKRIGFQKGILKPHNVPLTLLGAALLWFGWFGFNAGSSLEANGTAALAFANTWIAPAAAALSWTFAEWAMKGRPSLLGAVSGAVAGLVAITPAAGFVGVGGALIIGLLSGVAGLWGVHGLKRLLGADDSLDVFGLHGVCGIMGAVLTGVFASPDLGATGVWDYVTNQVAEGYSILAQVKVQVIGVGVTVVWTA
ncbi:MAG: ammonium transporter, partial [Microbacterium sp.]|nr:ammonium transporter [Microbacterium sp.]